MEVVATTWQNVEQKQHILDRKSSQAATTRNYQKTVFRFLPTQILVLLFKSVWVFFNSFIQIVLKRETETAAVKYICKYFQFLWLKNRQEGCSSVKLFSFVCYIKDRLEDMDVLLVFCHFIFKKFPCGTQNYLRIHLVVLVCSKVLNNSYFLGLESHSAKESTIYSLLPSDLNTSALKYYLCRAVSRTCKLKKLFSYISTKHLSRSHSHTNAQIILEKKCNSRVGWQQKNQNQKLDTCIYILWYIVVLQKETTL